MQNMRSFGDQQTSNHSGTNIECWFHVIPSSDVAALFLLSTTQNIRSSGDQQISDQSALLGKVRLVHVIPSDDVAAMLLLVVIAQNNRSSGDQQILCQLPLNIFL